MTDIPQIQRYYVDNEDDAIPDDADGWLVLYDDYVEVVTELVEALNKIRDITMRI